MADSRDRSRSPLPGPSSSIVTAPPTPPIVVSSGNAEEMDGTEHYGTANHRPSERREVRPGEGRRAEVGVIGQQRAAAAAPAAPAAAAGPVPYRQPGPLGPRAPYLPELQHIMPLLQIPGPYDSMQQGQGQQQEPARRRNQPWPAPADPTTTRHNPTAPPRAAPTAQVLGPVHATSSGPAPVPGAAAPVSRRDWYEYTVARTSTVATLNAATALFRALAAFTAAAAAAAEAAPEAPARPAAAQQPQAAAAAPQQRRLHQEQRPGTPTPGAQLTALAKARIAASEHLKTIATRLNDHPPRHTTVLAEARAEATERIRSMAARIGDPTEREEAERMLDRILSPSSLQSVRSLYARLPAWEEHAPPPPGWPFRLPGQRADMAAQRRIADIAERASVDQLARDREQQRQGVMRQRQYEAQSVARDLFEEMLANNHIVPASVSGQIPRLPRVAPSLVPSYEMVQLRDLPAMLSVQAARLPPEARVEDAMEEQVVPTGPSMRSTHVVPQIGSQASMREAAELQHRRNAQGARDIQARHAAAFRRAADEQARAAMDRGDSREQQSQQRERAARAAAASPPPPSTDTLHPGVVVAPASEPREVPPQSPLTLAGLRQQQQQLQLQAAAAHAQLQHYAMMTPDGRLVSIAPPPSPYPYDGAGLRPPPPPQYQPAGPAGPSGSGQAQPAPMRPLQQMQQQPMPAAPQQPQQQQQQPAQQQPKMIVHKLRPRTYRGPGQKRECNGLLGARRLIMEYKELTEKGGVARVEAAPKPENVRTWTAVVEGAEDSQFEGGVFFFDITFPLSYPAGTIKIACLTHIVHPHVFRSGMVNADEVAKLNYGVKFDSMKFGGVERSLMIAAALVSGKLPEASPEKRKQWLERGRQFTDRYAC